MRLSSALNKDRLCYSDTTPHVTHLLKKVNQAYMLGRLDTGCSYSISQRTIDNVSAVSQNILLKRFTKIIPPYLDLFTLLGESQIMPCLPKNTSEVCFQIRGVIHPYFDLLQRNILNVVMLFGWTQFIAHRGLRERRPPLTKIMLLSCSRLEQS